MTNIDKSQWRYPNLAPQLADVVDQVSEKLSAGPETLLKFSDVSEWVEYPWGGSLLPSACYAYGMDVTQISELLRWNCYYGQNYTRGALDDSVRCRKAHKLFSGGILGDLGFAILLDDAELWASTIEFNQEVMTKSVSLGFPIETTPVYRFADLIAKGEFIKARSLLGQIGEMMAESSLYCPDCVVHLHPEGSPEFQNTLKGELYDSIGTEAKRSRLRSIYPARLCDIGFLWAPALAIHMGQDYSFVDSALPITFFPMVKKDPYFSRLSPELQKLVV